MGNRKRAQAESAIDSAAWARKTRPQETGYRAPETSAIRYRLLLAPVATIGWPGFSGACCGGRLLTVEQAGLGRPKHASLGSPIPGAALELSGSDGQAAPVTGGPSFRTAGSTRP